MGMSVSMELVRQVAKMHEGVLDDQICTLMEEKATKEMIDSLPPPGGEERNERRVSARNVSARQARGRPHHDIHDDEDEPLSQRAQRPRRA